MEIINHDQRVVQRNYWFIKLRWYAIGGLFLMIILSMAISLNVQFFGLFIILTGLIIHNIISLYLLKRQGQKQNISKSINKLTFYQIVIDLIFLTILLYFSGGMENPFVLFYSFHIVLSSILLPRNISYWIAGIVSVLLLALGIVEYSKILPVYSLGFFNYASFNLKYLISLFVIFSVTCFILVYLVSSIAEKLRKQEQWLFLTNNKLKESNEMLKEKDRVKEEYVSRISHDIKGDLSVIQTNLVVLQKQITGELNENQMKFVNIALRRTGQLTNFTKQLLKITRSRLNNTTSKDLFSVNKTIQRIIEHYNSTAKEKNITVEQKIDQELFAYADSFSIEEALSNIISNAIKYTPEDGKITVYANKSGNYIEIIIEDNGIGIPKDDIPNLFKDFYRASNVMNKKIEGTGLGLSLVYNILQNNNGFIKVESAENKGSKFFIYIPTN